MFGGYSERMKKPNNKKTVRYDMSRKQIREKLEELHTTLSGVEVTHTTPNDVEDTLNDVSCDLDSLSMDVTRKNDDCYGSSTSEKKTYTNTRSALAEELNDVIETVYQLCADEISPNDMNDKLVDIEQELRDIASSLTEKNY
jgi:hypothetical protein